MNSKTDQIISEIQKTQKLINQISDYDQKFTQIEAKLKILELRQNKTESKKTLYKGLALGSFITFFVISTTFLWWLSQPI